VTRRREDLIATLVGELRPVRRALSPARFALAWLALAWPLSVALIALVGPMRPGWVSQLIGYPRFGLEFLLGVAAGVLGILGVARLSIPGPERAFTRAAPALGAFAGWIALVVVGVWDPALAPSMLGKRPYCVFEILWCAAPLVIGGFWLARRAAVFARGSTGALLGAVAAAIPAAWMQLACMYDPAHILALHLAPVALVALVGAALGRWILRRI